MTRASSTPASKKNQLPAKAKALRNALYKANDLNFPSLQAKKHVHKHMEVLGKNGSWYDSHRHLSWCWTQENKVRQQHADKVNVTMLYNYIQPQLAHTPEPSFSVLRQWAKATGVDVATIASVVDNLLPPMLETPVPVEPEDKSCESSEATLFTEGAAQDGATMWLNDLGEGHSNGKAYFTGAHPLQGGSLDFGETASAGGLVSAEYSSCATWAESPTVTVFDGSAVSNSHRACPGGYEFATVRWTAPAVMEHNFDTGISSDALNPANPLPLPLAGAHVQEANTAYHSTAGHTYA